MGGLEAEMSQQSPVDPTLCAAEPAPDRLDDGFSPPIDAQRPTSAPTAEKAPPEPALGRQSPF